MTGSEQSRSQVLIVRTRASKAETSNHSLNCDAQQEMEALIPVNTIAPTDTIWISSLSSPFYFTPNVEDLCWN
jgi:hypothetical protein